MLAGATSPDILAMLPIPWTENSSVSILSRVVAVPCIKLNHLPSLPLNSLALPDCKSVSTAVLNQPNLVMLLYYSVSLKSCFQ